MYTCTKRICKTRAEAAENLRRTKKRTKGYNGGVYYCRECQGFHIGRELGRTKPTLDRVNKYK